MRGLLIGAALLGGGGYFVASSGGHGADLERTVKATPYQTWKGYNLIFNDYTSALYEFQADGSGKERPKPVVASVDGKSIDYKLEYQGQPVLHLDIRFEPVENGAQTKLLINFETVPAGYRPSPGRPVPSLRPNPFFAIAMGKVIDKVDGYIETGEMGKVADSFSEIKSRMASDPQLAEMRKMEQDYRQQQAMRDASKPAVDPNAAAVNPRGTTVLPNDSSYRYSR